MRPSELHAGVEKLLLNEPEWPNPEGGNFHSGGVYVRKALVLRPQASVLRRTISQGGETEAWGLGPEDWPPYSGIESGWGS